MCVVKDGGNGRFSQISILTTTFSLQFCFVYAKCRQLKISIFLIKRQMFNLTPLYVHKSKFDVLISIYIMANDLGDSNEHLKFTRKRILILKLIFKKRWFIIYLIDLYNNIEIHTYD